MAQELRAGRLMSRLLCLLVLEAKHTSQDIRRRGSLWMLVWAAVQLCLDQLALGLEVPGFWSGYLGELPVQLLHLLLAAFC